MSKNRVLKFINTQPPLHMSNNGINTAMIHFVVFYIRSQYECRILCCGLHVWVVPGN